MTKLNIRRQPTTRIHPGDRQRLNELALVLGITQYEALRLALRVGFASLETNPQGLMGVEI